VAHFFAYSSIVKANREKVWSLYADVATINKISPSMARVTIEYVDLPLRAGSEIIFVGKYPPRLRWHARIEAFVAGSHFVDVQLSGPFAYWRHEHLFIAQKDETEMIDRLTFTLKGGLLVNGIFAPLVKLLLRAYFSYRHNRTRAILHTDNA
jgi:hypothetical protein